MTTPPSSATLAAPALAAEAEDTGQVKPGRLRWFAGDLRTGQIETYPPLEQTQWSVVINDAGAIEGSLLCADPVVAELEPRVTCAPCARFIGVEYIDASGTATVLQAGPVWIHKFNDDTGVLQIGGAGMWSYFDHRYVIPLLSVDDPAAAVTTHTGGMSKLAKQLVQLAQEYTGGQVPIVLPDDEAGDRTRTYKGADLLSIGEALKRLTDGEDPVEVMFVPRRTAADNTKIEWVLRVGTTTKPTLTQDGDDHVWNVSVPRRNMVSLSVDVDGAAMASRQWCPGSGSDELKIIGRADDLSLVDQGYVLLENVVSGHDNVELDATADAYAQDAVARSQSPVQTWDATVYRDDDPLLGTYFPGDWVRFKVASHLYLAKGDYRTRLVGFSGDDTPRVKLQLAPTIGGL